MPDSILSRSTYHMSTNPHTNGHTRAYMVQDIPFHGTNHTVSCTSENDIEIEIHFFVIVVSHKIVHDHNEM